MKIDKITSTPVWVGTRNQLLVKIDTDEGIYGWGESGLSGREKAVMGALDHFAEFLIGRNPMAIGALWQELYRSQYFEGGRVLLAAMSAIDLALYDIKGKALGVPVYELLGGAHRTHIPTFASTSAPPGEEMIEQAQSLMQAGWKAMRLSPAFHGSRQKHDGVYEPRESIPETAKWCVRAREELGDEVVLGIDYHHRLNVAETASFCHRMPTGTLDFLEEPIRDETPSAYQALRRMVDVPFAIGEEFASKWQFLPYIEGDLHQYNRIDVCNVGGLTEAMKVAGWSEAHYVDMMPHNPLGPICTAATIHFAAAVPNFSWLETRASPAESLGFDDQEIFPMQPKLDGAVYQVNDAPGLGVEVNEAALRKQEFRFWEAPHLKRPDGSVTNW
ncbi:mandelate racemase/muconate lactonizing enzyme family protein [Pseudoruegeria sp. HB172150]|uniref:mandelate racemase/muconate lactonizing enzyme family protein n=1 Tax=Pseudoruegeria sp. HB172150 TaxID=2721164 RepID=UPI0015555595|nr:mandelate racemase/muconate lactonizing enzyme family protein [Pseudoruegeria sp. HB172150]